MTVRVRLHWGGQQSAARAGLHLLVEDVNMCGKVTPVILHGVAFSGADSQPTSSHSSEFFIDNQLVGTHLIIEMILVNRPCAMGV